MTEQTQPVCRDSFDLSPLANVLPRFELGVVVATPGVTKLDQEGTINACEYLARHAVGDWGDLCHEDWRFNQRSLACGGRLMSSYRVNDQLKIWIVTEWDRSSTMLTLPSEY
ncbi:hypothetical protein E5C31_04445 [Providencia rettgeri]|uniref:hypothetical protein n=1 Tax=Alcaligenes TaxID=507 RepID=UPI000A2E1727|nr:MULTISPECIES: hypothetical protein [Alcaligenes]MBY6345210.1 hypothetical protein [Providencia rettgeri]MCB4321930.1 hypothetical protein [Alcaligenes sp. 13f]OSZ46393.1 hypothetical protein BVZ30_02545 [Alcaligenes faecalis]OSZ52808.1 hypothetical protein BVZ31_00540 [Alcaligenes faecalis]OSZ54875.1 hypothetical protein BVZ32_03340 [Alcaligenes faecalis]